MKTLLVVGSLNTDYILRADRLPAPGETLQAQALQTATGGKGANQAAAIARLGGSVRMVGNVGADAAGETLLRSLAAAGADVALVQRVEGASGAAMIFVLPSGENAIVIAAGANGSLGLQRIRDLHRVLADAFMVLTQLETPMDALDELALQCERLHVPLMLDPAPAQSISTETMRRVTWLTPNASETAALFGYDLGSATPDELAGFSDGILRDGPRNLLLKLGERGAYVATSDGVRVLVPAFSVKARDTTAAGDCFNGAFALRLQEGDDPAGAARFAAAAAALCVTRNGALPSLPTLDEVQRFLAANRKP